MTHRVGPYVLGKTLGVGSTGRVKLGTHVDTNHSVAVKIVSKEFLASKASLQKKIEREITLMKLIHHPNVMSLYDVYESDKELFLVLEFVEGGELFDYLVKRGRLPEREALIFFQQIINGLDFCHQHLVCHRDLKPENLLLDSSLNVKIADFGMATLQPEGKYLETSCGSPHYASPEIIKGEKYDGASADIWSCGVILYALLTGNLPFDDENIRKLLGKVKTGLYFLPNSLSEGSRDLIKRMLVVDPAKRITMHEIKQHPWYTSNSNMRTNSEILPPVLNNVPKRSEDLDMEVIANLQMLGYDNENELIKNILSPEKTMEQVFYLLLWERKKDYFENADPSDDAWDDPQGPRRRSSSASGAMFEKLGTRTSSSSASSNDTSSVPSSPIIANHTLSTSTDKYISSPLSASSSSSSVPAAGHASMSPPLSPIAETTTGTVTNLASSTGKSTPPTAVNVLAASNGRNSPELGRKSPASPIHMRSRSSSDGSRSLLTAVVSPKTKKKGVPAIDIPAGSTDPANQPMGSPRFHRRKGNDVPDVVEAPPSPGGSNSSSNSYTSTPKKSWFASLFSFKGEAFVARSKVSILESAETLQTVLKNLDIVFNKNPKEYSYKCRADMSGKNTRMRIDIVAGIDFQFDVLFTQERGSTQVFRSVVEQICVKAKFDTPQLQSGSPSSSPTPSS